MPDVIIFLGPSLEWDEAEKILPGEYLPPIKRGDLADIISRRPDLVIIIDGVFFEQSAVGHKEILSLLKAGIQVIGASSMGALRAAELEPFGMIGIGEVFRRYKEGIIDSDDEVALICDPVLHRPLSEAMVNITITCEKACTDLVLRSDESELIQKTARSLYYPDRAWKRILRDTPISQETKERFSEWMEKERIDQKRDDACEALRYAERMIAHV